MLAKHKGNKFELLIYKDLFGKHNCKRTIGSGSSFEPGDILLDNKFAVECKHLKKVRYSELLKFWSKLNNDIKSYNTSLEPIIIFRQNREPIMVMCVGSVFGKNVKTIVSYNIWRQLI